MLRKYNGIPKANFELFLKECEFRFNGSSRVSDRATPVHYGTPSQKLRTLKRWLRKEGVI